MLRVLGLVISIGLADSMNPSTIGPALYLAAGEDPVRNLMEFTLGVFGVTLLGGAVLVLGPGEAILSLVPRPSATTRYILETVAGVAMLIAAAYLWRRRERLGHHAQHTGPPKQRRPSALLGATIAAIELPSAFPYFAAIAAIVGSGLGLGQRVVLLAIYNVCFVLPLLVILGIVVVAGDRATAILGRARDFLRRRWPVLLAGLALVAGLFVTALGVTGLASAAHGPVGAVSRHVRRVISR